MGKKEESSPKLSDYIESVSVDSVRSESSQQPHGDMGEDEPIEAQVCVIQGIGATLTAGFTGAIFGVGAFQTCHKWMLFFFFSVLCLLFGW